MRQKMRNIVDHGRLNIGKEDRKFYSKKNSESSSCDENDGGVTPNEVY